jgi:hypothetical protein
MSTHASLTVESNTQDRLLHVSLPALLAKCGCAEQSVALRRVLVDGDENDVIDVLEDCWADGCDAAALSQGEEAGQAERVSAMARHLAQHLALRDAAPATASRHLQRAAQIALDLGHGPGPSGVVH